MDEKYESEPIFKKEEGPGEVERWPLTSKAQQESGR